MSSGFGSHSQRRYSVCEPKDLVWLSLLALTLRVAYLISGLWSLDLSTFAMVASDSTVYMDLGEFFRTGQGEAGRHLLVAGPGYPALLAGLSMLFGTGPWPPVILNMLFGAVAPVAVYLLAATLFGDRTVARLSGLLVAFSFTGLSLSTSILTDQPFFTLHAFGLVAFVFGLKSGRSRWFVISGLLSGFATFIRSMGQLWPYLYFAMAVLHLWYSPRPRDLRRLARSLWTPAIMLVVILSWSAVNQARYGMFTFTTNGVRATWAYLAAMAVADHTPGGTIDSVREAWSAEVLSPIDGHFPPDALIMERMKGRIVNLVAQHPDWLLESFLISVWRNVREPNYFADQQVPQWRATWEVLRRFCHDRINPLIFVLALASLGLLVRKRQWESLIVLGATYGYFTWAAGFSFWQGSRLHFPAEMAWSILVSYLSVLAWRRFGSGAPGRPKPAQTAA